MSRPLTVSCIVLAVSLLVAAGFLFSRMTGGGGPSWEDGLSGSSALRAVPLDALAIYRTDSMSDAGEILSLFAPDFLCVVSALSDCGVDAGAVLSVHSTGNSRLSLLLSCILPDGFDSEKVTGSIGAKCSGVTRRSYDSYVIYSSTSGHISFACREKCLLCSSSRILLESAIRQYGSGESLTDDPVFNSSLAPVSSEESLTLNHNLAGKLMAGVAPDRRRLAFYKARVRFISHITKWSSFSVRRRPAGCVSGTCSMAGYDGPACYASLFTDRKGQKSDLTDILPFNTVGCLSFRISDPASFIRSYGMFRGSIGHTPGDDDGELSSMAVEAGVSEVACAMIPDGDSWEKILFIRADRPEILTGCSAGEVSGSSRCHHLASVLAGDFFRPTDTTACCSPFRGWVMAGSRGAADRYMQASGCDSLFTLSQWLSQTPVGNACGRRAVISAAVNLSMLSDSLQRYLNDEYLGQVKTGMAVHDFNYLIFSVNAEGGRPVPRYSFWSMNLDRTPSQEAAGDK